jgi:hypothetical protein
LAEGHVPHTVPVFFNQDDGALPECFGAMGSTADSRSMTWAVVVSRSLKTTTPVPRPFAMAAIPPEVEREDVDVGETPEPFVAQVDGLMTHVAQPARHLHGEPHVGEEPHPVL